MYLRLKRGGAFLYEASTQKVRRIGNLRGSGHVTRGGSGRTHIWAKQTPEMEQVDRARIKNAQGKFQTPSELGEIASRSWGLHTLCDFGELHVISIVKHSVLQ